jgi:hypothetical protein
MQRSHFDNMAELKETKIACASQIKVWRVNGEGKVLSINIPHPFGENVEMWPPIEGLGGKRIKAAFRRVVPTKLRFSSDGKRLISETDAGFRTIYDSQTGRTLRHSNTSSVGVFKSMLIIALHQVPTDVTVFTLKLTPSECSVHVSRRTDGWWQVSRRRQPSGSGKEQKYGFKVNGEDFVSNMSGVEKKEGILTLLGLKEDTRLAELVTVEHPLGVIKITRKKTGFELRLEEL